VEFQTKPDFDAARRRWQAFWDGQAMDRPLLQIVVPKPGRQAVGRPYPVRPDRPIEPVIEQTLAWADAHEFLAEAVPFYTMEFGPEHFATLLGAQMHYNEGSAGTGWALPFVEDWDRAEIRFRPESFYWTRTVEILRAMRAACDGKVLICAPVLSGGLDALSAVRGPRELLTDLLDRPDQIQRALADVRRAYHQVVEALAAELDWQSLGSANWNGMYHPRRTNTIQSDVSCMLSSRMYEEFEVPSLRDQAAHFDAVAYHLDGPGAVHHLPAIAAIEGIRTIQYVPGPKDNDQHVEEVYRQIDSLGQPAVRYIAPQAAHDTWNALATRRAVYAASLPTRREAEEFIESF
jgi:hypothetical protein